MERVREEGREKKREQGSESEEREWDMKRESEEG